MPSSAAISREEAVAWLEQTLASLTPTLERLAELLVEQREAAVRGAFERLAAATAEQETMVARMARLERRREELQRQLERAFGIQGLRAIGDCCSTGENRQRFLQLVEELGASVVRLQRENQRCAALLGRAMDAAQRRRLQLERLAGVRAAYDPVRLRCKQSVAPAAGAYPGDVA